MGARQTTLPRRLVEPGPNPEQLQRIYRAAATAPDHGQLQPWRFVVINTAERGLLADAFATALLARDAAASQTELSRAHEKAFRSPFLLLAVLETASVDPAAGADIDTTERLISAGCAVQNMLLMATAQGFGSALTSGKALKSPELRALFGLSSSEMALCFISIGSVQTQRPVRTRPEPADFVSTLASSAPLSPTSNGAFNDHLKL